jgi:hypothetical protein
MANAVYPLWKQALMHADTNVNLDTDTTVDGVFCALVTATYVYSAAHQFYTSITGRAGTDQRITGGSGITITNGTFANNGLLTYNAVATGPAIVALILYRSNSLANTNWRLVLFEDTGVTGLPVTPNGGNITITWNASGIFTL